jgi:hypothetical protein
MDLWVIYNEDLKQHIVSTSTPTLADGVKVVPVTIPSGLPARVALETALSAISNVANLGGTAQYVAAKITFA